MRIQLNLQLNKQLREKINEYSTFINDMQVEFLSPSRNGKRNRKTTSAYNCVCAVLDRIDDWGEYCNSIEINNDDKSGVFKLCEFFNCSQTLIDCITKIGSVFGIKYEFQESDSVFNQLGDNDDKYFKYLRSLCSAHPVDTNKHGEYQGEEPEWCPYITSGKTAINKLRFLPNSELGKADFFAIVYRNDLEWYKRVPIYVEQLFEYVEKRYNFIKKIIIKINDDNKDYIEELKGKHILLPEECNNYIDYLEKLKESVAKRCGKYNSYIAKEWIAIMTTAFQNASIQELFTQYQEALKAEIQIIHNNLQTMGDDGTIDLQPFPKRRIPELHEYGYETEKLFDLYPETMIENEECEPAEFQNKAVSFDIKRMSYFLSEIENCIKQGMGHTELRSICRSINSNYAVSNSEWARMQLKTIEFVFEKYMKFDYMLNDWHLYMQIELAMWLLSKDEKRV